MSNERALQLVSAQQMLRKRILLPKLKKCSSLCTYFIDSALGEVSLKWNLIEQLIEQGKTTDLYLHLIACKFWCEKLKLGKLGESAGLAKHQTTFSNWWEQLAQPWKIVHFNGDSIFKCVINSQADMRILEIKKNNKINRDNAMFL